MLTMKSFGRSVIYVPLESKPFRGSANEFTPAVAFTVSFRPVCPLIVHPIAIIFSSANLSQSRGPRLRDRYLPLSTACLSLAAISTRNPRYLDAGDARSRIPSIRYSVDSAYDMTPLRGSMKIKGRHERGAHDLRS